MISSDFLVEIQRRESKMCPLIIARSFIGWQRGMPRTSGTGGLIDSNDWR